MNASLTLFDMCHLNFQQKWCISHVLFNLSNKLIFLYYISWHYKSVLLHKRHFCHDCAKILHHCQWNSIWKEHLDVWKIYILKDSKCFFQLQSAEFYTVTNTHMAVNLQSVWVQLKIFCVSLMHFKFTPVDRIHHQESGCALVCNLHQPKFTSLHLNYQKNQPQPEQGNLIFWTAGETLWWPKINSVNTN